MQDAVFEYTPRKPEETVLYRVVAKQLETFLARQQDRERPIPKFVEREFRSFLECGIPAYGFVRVHCDSRGHDRVVAFSCKGRVWCPSSGGRRMADTAAHLVDSVFPIVPVRQWVLSTPFALRYRMAYDPRLTSCVLNVFARAVLGHQRRRARKLLGIGASQSGAVTFIQVCDCVHCVELLNIKRQPVQDIQIRSVVYDRRRGDSRLNSHGSFAGAKGASRWAEPDGFESWPAR
jgi:Transposase zinc-binding domain